MQAVSFTGYCMLSGSSLFHRYSSNDGGIIDQFSTKVWEPSGGFKSFSKMVGILEGILDIPTTP